MKSDKKGVKILKSTDAVKGIQDDEFFYSEDELSQIRNNLTMYISRDGNDGAIHLFKEILANAIDECNNVNSHWKKHKKNISVAFLESKGSITVSDNGRGIPADILKDVIMKKHASSKTVGVSDSRNKKVTGLNGVGLTICAALTDYMCVESYRGGYCKRLVLKDGVITSETEEELPTFKTGTSLTIVPSEKYLGNIALETDMIEGYIRNMSYIMDPDITLTFTGEVPPDKDGGEPELFTHIYRSKGLSEAVNFLSSSLEFPPIEAKVVTDDFDISIAFSYDKTLDESVVASFCNYVITTEGGCHIVAATQAICSYFTREAKRQDPNSKLEVSFDDCRKGLVMAVNLEHIRPKFEGQHKTKVSNNDVITEGKKALTKALYNVMNNNPPLLKKIITYLRQISKARQEAHKIKGITVKKHSTFLEDSKIAKYFTVSNRNSTAYKELFLAEGDSAAGGILNSRNAAYQAVYTVNGVINNVQDMTIGTLLQKPMFRELVQILGTGIGKDFDITKLRYDKIIICTDSDVDGMNITSLLLYFFFSFMPDLITEGKIYKAMAPLYLMDVKSLRKFYKGREWLYDKSEYYHMLNTIIVDNCDICIERAKKPGGKGKNAEIDKLSKADAMAWLNMNSEYKLELDNLGKKAACNTHILEMVCYYKLLDRFNKTFNFRKNIEKEFPELTYNDDTKSLVGSYNGEYRTLICDDLFDKSASRFMRMLVANADSEASNLTPFIWYKNKKDPDDKYIRATVGQFLDAVSDIFAVEIDQRFKGLGEADPELLFRTVTNPKFRKLLRINIDAFEEASGVFEILHGKSPAARKARRDLIDNTHLSYADIDN